MNTNTAEIEALRQDVQTLVLKRLQLCACQRKERATPNRDAANPGRIRALREEIATLSALVDAVRADGGFYDDFGNFVQVSL
jgi:hypothetical protein